MANSRLISSDDLITGGFDDLADDWSIRRDIAGNATDKLNAAVVGVSPSALNLGTGWGTILSDGITVKSALQLLETNLESNQIQDVLNVVNTMQSQIDALLSIFSTKPIDVAVEDTVTGTVYTATSPIVGPTTWTKISGYGSISISTSGVISINATIPDTITRSAIIRVTGENSAMEFTVNLNGYSPIPSNALYSAIDGSLLYSAIDGSILTSAIA